MQKASPKSTVAPKVHRLNFGMFRCLFRYSTDAGTSSWLWSFNLLLLRLLGEISLSLLCSRSSWGSALDLDLPLCVGRLRASVPRPDRTGLKEQLIQGLWLTQAGGREGYGCGASLRRQRRRDVAAAWGAPLLLFFIMFSKLKSNAFFWFSPNRIHFIFLGQTCTLCRAHQRSVTNSQNFPGRQGHFLMSGSCASRCEARAEPGQELHFPWLPTHVLKPSLQTPKEKQWQKQIARQLSYENGYFS